LEIWEDGIKYVNVPFYKEVPIPPFTNPSVERLRAKLKRQRVVFTEEILQLGDINFIKFKSA
jgi:hypothetical protein